MTKAKRVGIGDADPLPNDVAAERRSDITTTIATQVSRGRNGRSEPNSDDAIAPAAPIVRDRVWWEAEAARLRNRTSIVEAALFMLATTGMIADPENMSDWDEPNWRDAAIEYHRDRPRGPAIESERLARLRRLMADGVSLDCAWHELRANRPTPKTTTDAIIVTVRECGLQALQEPVNQVRLRRCDPEARARLDHWL